MVPGHLLEFTPSSITRAQELVTAMEGVLEVQTYGLMLHVFVDDVPRRQPEIEAMLAAQGIACQGMRQIQVRMEEAFISLVQSQSAR